MFLYCSDFKAQANEGRTYSIRKISLLGQRKKKKWKIKNENEVFQWIVLVRGGRESENLRPDKMMIINWNEILTFPVLKRETGPLNRHFLSFLTLAWQKKRQKKSRASINGFEIILSRFPSNYGHVVSDAFYLSIYFLSFCFL